MGYSYRFTDREIALYKKEKALSETKRIDLTNACLVAFRRNNLYALKNNPQLRQKFINLNQTVREKPIEQILKVFNFWIEEEDFTSPRKLQQP